MSSQPSEPPVSLTTSLTALIRAKPVAQADLDAAALFLLDALANSLAGARSEPGGILLNWAGNQHQSVAQRSFLGAALCHILETDDLHRASIVHPGCVVGPLAWVLGKSLGAGGPKILTALLHGFEAATRVGMAVGPAHYRIWHNTATCGPYGAAMAAAHLLDLDPGQTVHALGNAGSQSAGLWEFLETGAMTKHLHAGHASEAGLKAAELAAHGFTGPPRILEGDKGFFRAACPDAVPEAVLARPDAPWQLLATSIKPWPSCRHTHPAIDAAGEVGHALKDQNIPQDQIASVRVDTYGAALDVCNRPRPQTDYEAKFSLQHATAIALLRGQVDFDAFSPAARRQAASLAAKVSPVLAEPYASAYPKSWGSAVTVVLSNGKQITAARTHAKGDPEAALSRQELIDKALMLLKFAEVTNAEKVTDDILALACDGSVPTLPSPLY